MSRIASIAIGVLALALLDGCAMQPQQSAPGSAAETQQKLRASQLSDLHQWRLRGRAAVIERNQGWQANVKWAQNGQDYRIDLWGPFGQGAAVVEGNTREASLWMGADHWRADSADELLAKATGHSLPIGGLRHWLFALAAPDADSQFDFDRRGRPFRIRQNGWTIEYPEYTVVDGVDMPRKLRAERGDLAVKLVVQSWSLAPN